MGINKIILYTLTTIAIVIFLFLLIFYSTILANNSFIIQVRNRYFAISDNFIPKGWFIYKTRPISYDNGRYLYRFVGEFQKIDLKNDMIVLKDIYGNIWNFKYKANSNKNEEGANYKIIDYGYYVKSWGKDADFKLQKMGISTDNLDTYVPHFKSDDLIMLFWSDTRKLIEIERDQNQGNTTYLNGVEFVQINRIVWK